MAGAQAGKPAGDGWGPSLLVLTVGRTLGAPGFLWGGCLIRHTPSLGDPELPFTSQLLRTRVHISPVGQWLLCSLALEAMFSLWFQPDWSSPFLISTWRLSCLGEQVGTPRLQRARPVSAPPPWSTLSFRLACLRGEPIARWPPRNPAPPPPSTGDPDCIPFPPSAGATRCVPAQGV